MAQAPFILADTAENLGAIIFMIVVFVLWGFGALASAMNRQKKRQAEEARRREMFERMQREARARDLAAMARQRPPAAPPLPPRPPMLPTAPPLPIQTVPPQAPPLPTLPPRQQRRTKRTRPVPSWQEPLPPQTEVHTASIPASPDRAEGTAQQAPRSKQPTPAARAAAVSKWLTADTIRSQFILTEILQPPLALREPRDV